MQLILGNILAIYRKELKGYFASPLAYVIAAVFWLLAGLFFTISLQWVVQQAASQDLQGQQMGMPPQPLDVPSSILRYFLGFMSILVPVILPILSMGLYAEERKRGTLELLATSPVTNWAVATGKWLGVFTFFVTLVLPVMAYQAIAYSTANPPMPPWMMLAGHGGLLLLAGAILSLGLFISALTDSSILAAILTLGLILVLVFLDWIAQNIGGPVGEVLSHLSLFRHYNDLTQGVLESSGIALFCSYIFLGIFLAAQSIDVLRFQRS